MGAVGFHLMCRLRDGRVIARDVRERRILARAVISRTRGDPLVAFGMPDTHLHALIAAGGATPPEEIGRRIQISLTRVLDLDVGFEKAAVKRIETQWHLTRCFDYVLRQQQRHDLDVDPFHEASSLPDLLGMRLLDSHTARQVARLLPRVSRAQLLGHLGVERLEPAAVDEALTRDPGLLLDATAAAIAAPRLVGSSGAVRAAYRTAIALLEPSRRKTEIALLLGIHRRTVHRLRRLPLDEALLQAIRLQLALRRAKPDAGERFLPPRPAEQAERLRMDSGSPRA